MSPPPVRVLIFTASIGEGHDLPAALLARAIEREQPGTDVTVLDGLAAMGPVPRRVAIGGSRFDSDWGNRAFDVSQALVTDVAPTRAFAAALLTTVAGRRVLRCVRAHAPDVVVSTYPGVTEVLGRLRGGARLPVAAVSAITDLSSLRWWAHPGIDLHLVTHPESAAEIAAIAPGAAVRAVRGFSCERFYEPIDRAAAREALGLPARAPVVVVSGGGWVVGDVEGGVEAALAVDGAVAVVLCGRDRSVRERIEARFGAGGRVHALGFTDEMPELLAAADVLVHSTAGLTVLEALMSGCAVVSYGWGRGHIRANNRAFERHGLAYVARDREQLRDALARALAAPRAPDRSFAALPSAASEVLALARGEQAADPLPAARA